MAYCRYETILAFFNYWKVSIFLNWICIDAVFFNFDTTNVQTEFQKTSAFYSFVFFLFPVFGTLFVFGGKWPVFVGDKIGLFKWIYLAEIAVFLCPGYFLLFYHLVLPHMFYLLSKNAVIARKLQIEHSGSLFCFHFKISPCSFFLILCCWICVTGFDCSLWALDQ